jgi:hypothetical protein
LKGMELMARFRISLLALISTVVLSGCGSDDGLGRRYAVSGTITYKGQPLEKGAITFYPVTPDPKGVNNGANAAIVGGKYQLSTRGDSDGAFEGEYVVAIESKDVDMTAAKSGRCFKGLSQGEEPDPFEIFDCRDIRVQGNSCCKVKYHQF